jgi:hypothetical protein
MFDRSAFLSSFSRARSEAARLELLAGAAAALAPASIEDLVTLVEECWRTGDNGERQAILRALPRLPSPERFVPLGVSACRTHVVPIFEAIAAENPFPARHFPELAFNQMVLKALFVGVAIDRIVDLGRRVTPELRRMADAYASERRAAGRPVPDDCTRLVSWRSS